MNLSSPTLRTILYSILGIFLLLVVIKIFNISYPISVTSRAVSGELAVVGEGKVEVVPNTASVQVGIVVSSVNTVSDAQRQIDETNNRIVESLKNLGIEENDIKTSNYSINPNYNFEEGRNTISGYNGNATLTVKVRDTEKLPQVIEQATASGANQVYDTQYIVDKPEEYREQARDKAIENAREQARKLADSLGIRLGKIVNIVETSPTTPVYSLNLEARGGGASADLQPGSQTITSTVTLFFERP